VVQVNGRLLAVVGKATVGFALHWPALHRHPQTQSLEKGDEHMPTQPIPL